MVSAMISLALLPENFFCLRSPGYSIIRRYNNTISGGRRTQVRANKPEMLDTTADWISTFLLGWAVTIVSGISAYPLDTVKRQESILCRQIKIEAAFISDFKYDLKWIKEYDQDTNTII